MILSITENGDVNTFETERTCCKGVTELGHGFVALLERNQYAGECYRNTLAFLRKYTEV